MTLINEFQSIRDWAEIRGLYAKGDPKTQFIKLTEEIGELSKAILINNREESIDAIGDCVIVLTNLAYMLGIPIEKCINSAFNEIKDRKGKIDNGTFIKDGN